VVQSFYRHAFQLDSYLVWQALGAVEEIFFLSIYSVYHVVTDWGVGKGLRNLIAGIYENLSKSYTCVLVIILISKFLSWGIKKVQPYRLHR